MSFKEFVPDEISHPVFYDDLVYKLRRVRVFTISLPREQKHKKKDFDVDSMTQGSSRRQ